MRVAVTGGSGFVGAHSVQALLDAGHEVRLLVHPGEQLADSLGALGVEISADDIVVGDVCDPAAVDQLLDGCDALLHAAGIVGTDDRREPLMWRINVDATALVLGAAATRGLDPIIHVASYSALFPTSAPVIGPDTPSAIARSAYGRTKSAADRFARGLQAAGAPVVVTYPSSVVGPPAGHRRGITADGFTPLFKMGFTTTFDGGMMMVDVRDVATAHVRIMEQGRGPRRYTLGGTFLTFDEMLDEVSRAKGTPIRRIRVSGGAMRGIGRAADLAGKFLPLSPGVSFEAMWLLTAAVPMDDTRTIEELGMVWRPVRESLEDALRR